MDSRLRPLLACVLVAFATAPPAHAAPPPSSGTYYIDSDPSRGDDTNDCQVPADDPDVGNPPGHGPCATIAEALTKAAGTITIHLAIGTYTGPPRLERFIYFVGDGPL